MYRIITRLILVCALGCGALLLAGRTLAAALPGGGQIVFSSDRDGDFDLYLLDVGSGFTYNLMANDRTTARDDQAAWSPDGARLVYRSTLDGPNAAMIFDLRTGERSAVASNANISLTMTPIWSPGGETVALAGNNGWLALVDPASGARHPLPRTPFLYAMSWSPDGREIVYSAPTETGVRLYAFLPHNGTQRQLTHSPVFVRNTKPSWRPS